MISILSISPSEVLSLYVAQFLFLSNIKESNSLFKMVPRNNPVFLFTSPDLQTMYKSLPEQDYFFEPGNSYFSGLGTQPALMHINGSARIIVVLLRPWCTGFFLKEDAVAFTDSVHCITNQNKELTLLNEKLWQDTPTIQKQTNILENYLLKVVPTLSPSPYLLRAFNSIEYSSGCISVKDLEKCVFSSSRHLLRLFNQHVGVNPKKYISMIRFSSFLKEYINSPEKEIELLASKYQYHDLSHLHKTAVQYIGSTPTQFKSEDHTVNKELI